MANDFRRLLVVSPHFPPVNAPDLQRVRMSLPHWIEAGWRVTVLAAEPEESSQAVEPELLETLPPEAEIIRLRPLPRKWTKRLGLGNLGWRLLPALFWSGRKLLSGGSFDLVYFSTTQFACLPLGRVWRRLTGTPYVIDLQDPWVNSYYARAGVRPPGGWKYPIVQWLARRMEKWTLRRCSGLITVSPAYPADLEARYPGFSSMPRLVLPFGFSIRDLERTKNLISPPADRPLRLLYTGRLGRDMQKPFRLLLEALRVLPQTPGAPRVEAEFFGASYSPEPHHEKPAEPLPAGIRFHPARIGFLESLRRQSEADVLLIMGSDDPSYNPSKIHFLLAQAKPILALVDDHTVLAAQLDQWPQVCRIVPQQNAEALRAIRQFLLKPQDFQPAEDNLQRLKPWESQASADAQLNFFRTLLPK